MTLDLTDDEVWAVEAALFHSLDLNVVGDIADGLEIEAGELPELLGAALTKLQNAGGE